MREKAANADVVNLLPSALANVAAEYVKVLRVGFDRVRRGVALAQVAQELVNGFLDCRTGGLTFHLAALAFARG
jgi:hypothetical protein